MKKKSVKKRNNTLKYLAFILVIFLLSFGGSYLYSLYFTDEKSQPGKVEVEPEVKELIEEKAEKNYNDKDDNKIDVSTYINNLPSYRSQYSNDDIVGKLDIPNLNIDTLVTRTQNNVFYLSYNLYKQRDGLGVPFFDFRNTDLANDRQINIYGHNTQNEKYISQLPFTNLEAYTDVNIFNNYKDVYLSIDEKQINYKVVAAKIITADDNEHMKLIFYSDDDFLQHVNKLINNSLYVNKNLKISAKDKLLVLQVCHYNPPNTYLLIICKEV